MKGPLKTFAAALNRKDGKILTELARIPSHAVIIPLEHLHSDRIKNQALAVEDLDREQQTEFFSPQKMDNPTRLAVRSFRNGVSRERTSAPLQIRIPLDELNRIAREWDAVPFRKEDFAGKSKSGGPARSIQEKAPSKKIHSGFSRAVSPFRIHDWNPDIRIAHKAGVAITFSGERNEIRCPDLNLSSSQVTRSTNLVTITGISSEISGTRSYGSSGGSGTMSSGGQRNSEGMNSQSAGTASGSRTASSGSSSRGGSSRSGSTKK